MPTATELAERIRESARRVTRIRQKHAFGSAFTYSREEIQEGLEEIADAVGKLEGVTAEIKEDGALEIHVPGQQSIYDVAEAGETHLGPFAADSETSRKAALANYPRSGSQRFKILELFSYRRHIGTSDPRLTRDGIAHELGMSGDAVRPRVLELIEGGWLRETEDTRPTRSGNDAVLLEQTEKVQE